MNSTVMTRERMLAKNTPVMPMSSHATKTTLNNPIHLVASQATAHLRHHLVYSHRQKQQDRIPEQLDVGCQRQHEASKQQDGQIPCQHLADRGHYRLLELRVIVVEQKPESALTQLQCRQWEQEHAHRQAQVIVAIVGRVINKIGVKRHHQKRDDARANGTYGVDAKVLNKLLAARRGIDECHDLKMPIFRVSPVQLVAVSG